MRKERQHSTAIVSSFVRSKEIRLVARRSESKHFDPNWLFERCMTAPEPPDTKELRCLVRSLIVAAHALIKNGRPNLAGELFERAFLLLNDQRGVTSLRAKCLAGIMRSWNLMGRPSSGSGFTSRAMQNIEQSLGTRTAALQERQLRKAVVKSRGEAPKPKIAIASERVRLAKRAAHMLTDWRK